MTETQTQQRSATDEDVAEAIALVLSGEAAVGAGITPLALIALLLKRAPGVGSLDSSSVDSVARLVLADIPELPGATGATLGATRAAHRANLKYRGFYAVNAVRRVAGKVLDGETLRAAMEGERTNFASHLDASRERVTGAKINDAMAEKYGDVLGWYDTGQAKSHTPEHRRASGNNFRVASPPAETDGYLPAQRLHCDCVPGPPHPRGRLMA